MASVVTTEFVRTIHADAPPFSLIEQQSLVSRLIQAVGSAVHDFAGDPRGFIRELLSANTKDAKRRKRIYFGLAGALVVHVVMIGLIAVIGWRSVFVKQPVEQTPQYTFIPLEGFATEKLDSAVPEKPKGVDSGGGGGGQQTLTPASKGVPPLMMPTPQIVNMNPSNIPEPALAVSPTVLGPISPPPPPGPIGDPAGKSGAFSGGPGSGGGVGGGNGPGVGGGKDGGVGDGSRGGSGGKPIGLPEGTGTSTPSVLDYAQIKSMRGYQPWRWIQQRRPIVTPEAQENKVMGTVLLRATFNADGTITDIEVVMRVDFMNEAAVESLRRSSFRPATINGVPVTVRKVPIKVDVHY
jgi:TonB family protein